MTERNWYPKPLINSQALDGWDLSPYCIITEETTVRNFSQDCVAANIGTEN